MNVLFDQVVGSSFRQYISTFFITRYMVIQVDQFVLDFIHKRYNDTMNLLETINIIVYIIMLDISNNKQHNSTQLGYTYYNELLS